MRIIGGNLRGLSLTAVGKGDEAAHLRPTSDRVRETIFNLLINGGYGNPVENARVLDVFAGTGALGLEALSRGAAHVTFVENGAKAGAILRRNIEVTRSAEQTDILRRDATRMPDNPGAPFDLVFMDPPYSTGLGDLALASCRQGRWVAAGALVVWEDGTAPAPQDGFERLDMRRYGDTFVAVLRAAETMNSTVG